MVRARRHAARGALPRALAAGVLGPLALVDKRAGVTPGGVARNWLLVFLGNFAGALMVAGLMAFVFTYGFSAPPGPVGEKIAGIGVARTLGYARFGLASWLTIFVRGKHFDRRRSASAQSILTRGSSPRGAAPLPHLVALALAREPHVSVKVTGEALETEEARLLAMLERLAELPGLELAPALSSAADCVSSALRCEKVDAFLLDEAHQTLRALGTSETPLGQRQKALGLDTLALANGGRIVSVFESGQSYLEQHAENDPEELRGIVHDLGVRSTVSAPLEVNGVRRGVLAAASTTPEFFHARDLQFLTIVARWIGMLVHRAELAEHSRHVESEQARRRGADQVVTVLAHDLRNLLQPLVARLQGMRLGLASGTPVSAPQVDSALATVQRLSRLTEDLLDLRRLDEGLFSLRLAPVDLAAILRETAANIGTAATPVNVKGEPALVAVVDEQRVRQALENLVANATRYSPRGKAVELELGTELRAGIPHASIQVLDSGPGIAPELARTLFDPFVFGAGSKGIGLGLHLARRIARVHAGELSVHARVMGGTCFRLTLPLQPPEIEGG
jgi:signal transduction histidine kinase